MLNPKVMVGECSIQVMLRGELLMTIPHRLWESGVSEEGEVVWSGELRGDHTTAVLVRYLEGRIRGSEDQRDLFNRLDEFMGELKCPMWRKTLREEGIEKKKEKEDRERTKRGVENPVEVVEVVEVVEWRRAA
jgi:CO dehydrogenase/acetyl-CoA synthase beta subunit